MTAAVEVWVSPAGTRHKITKFPPAPGQWTPCGRRVEPSPVVQGAVKDCKRCFLNNRYEARTP